jgi:hypothetical protein
VTDDQERRAVNKSINRYGAPGEATVKVVNHAKYVADSEKVAKFRPAHRGYMDELLAQGRLVAGGPFTDGSGALFIYEVGSLAEAEEIVAGDPYTSGEAFSHCDLRPWEIVKSSPALLVRDPSR